MWLRFHQTQSHTHTLTPTHKHAHSSQIGGEGVGSLCLASRILNSEQISGCFHENSGSLVLPLEVQPLLSPGLTEAEFQKQANRSAGRAVRPTAWGWGQAHASWPACVGLSSLPV